MITYPKGDDTKTCRVCQRHPVCTDHERICDACRFNIAHERDESFTEWLERKTADIVAAGDEALPFDYVDAVEEE